MERYMSLLTVIPLTVPLEKFYRCRVLETMLGFKYEQKESCR